MRTALRFAAMALPVPSIGVLAMRIRSRRAARELAPEVAVDPAE